MRLVINDFPLEHRLDAVGAGVQGVGRTDADVEGGGGVPQGGGKDVGGSQTGARDKSGGLSLGISAEGSHCRAALRTCPATEQCPLVLSAQAQHAAWEPELSSSTAPHLAQGTGSVGPAAPTRTRTASTNSSSVRIGPWCVDTCHSQE